MMPLLGPWKVGPGQGVTQPELSSALCGLPFSRLSRSVNGRVVSWVILVFAWVLIGLLFGLLLLLVRLSLVRHLLAPCRRSRRTHNPPVDRSFRMLIAPARISEAGVSAWPLIDLDRNDLIFLVYIEDISMAKVSREELIDAASQFVEAMPENLDRSFELVNFRSYVRVHHGWLDDDWHDMEGEAALIQYFNGHYDLERQPIGMRWDFINNTVERQFKLDRPLK